MCPSGVYIRCIHDVYLDIAGTNKPKSAQEAKKVA